MFDDIEPLFRLKKNLREQIDDRVFGLKNIQNDHMEDIKLKAEIRAMEQVIAEIEGIEDARREQDIDERDLR